MPRGGQELKFSSPLTQAFAAVERARSSARSVQLLCFPRSEWIDEFQQLLESLTRSGRDESPSVEICIWSPWDHSPYSPIASSLNPRRERLRTLSSLHHRRSPIIILASVEAWSLPTINRREYSGSILDLIPGQEPGSRDSLKKRLKSLGYIPTDLVELSNQKGDSPIAYHHLPINC